MSTVPTEEIKTLEVPKPVWKWDFFGDGFSFIITICREVPWYKRIATKFFFGSKWERL